MNIAALRSEMQFSGNSAQKDRREHSKTLQWRFWFGISQSSVVVTTLSLITSMTFSLHSVYSGHLKLD